MNFSLQRCIQLFRLQLVTDRKIYMYGALALFAVQFSVLLYYVYSSVDGLYFDNQKMIAEQGLVLFNFIMAAWCFRSLHSRSTRLQALMLPVTVMERLAVGIFFTIVLFPAVYILAYLMSGGLAHYIDSHVLMNGNRFYYFNDNNSVNWRSLLMLNLVLIFTGLAASAVFRKLAVVKAIVMFALLFISINLLNDAFANLLLDHLPLTEEMMVPGDDGRIPVGKVWDNHSFLSSWTFSSGDADGNHIRYYEVEVPEYLRWIENMLGYLMLLTLPYLTILKLREQELS